MYNYGGKALQAGFIVGQIAGQMLSDKYNYVK